MSRERAFQAVAGYIAAAAVKLIFDDNCQDVVVNIKPVRLCHNPCFLIPLETRNTVLVDGQPRTTLDN